MKTNQGIFRAELEGGIELQELEALVTSQGGTMLRVDRDEKRTAAFFAGGEESAKQAYEALSQYGKAQVD